MKKLPILLSTLTLAGTGVNVAALEAGTMTDLGNAGKTSMIANEKDPRAQIISIIPETTGIVVKTEHFDKSRVLKRAYLATYDFETGITEGEADVKALQLGENGKESWMKQYYARTIKEDMTEWNTVMVYFTDPDAIDNLHELNPTDLFYYALEYVGIEDEGLESVWVRGKIDYRTCVKASTYGGQYWAECKPVEVADGAGGVRNVFLPDGQTTVEANLPTWEDDLKQIAKDSLKDVESQVTELEQRVGRSETLWLSEVKALAAEFEEKKGYIERIHATDLVASDTWLLGSRLDWLVMMATPEEVTPEPGTDDKDDKDDKEDKETEEGGSDDKDTDDKETGDKESSGDGTDNKKDETGESKDDTEKEPEVKPEGGSSSGSTGMGGALGTTGVTGVTSGTDNVVAGMTGNPENVVENTKTEVKTPETNSTTSRIPVIVTATMGSAMGQILGNDENVDEVASEDADQVLIDEADSEVEVPNLGDDEAVVNRMVWVWWIVGISLGGLAIWWVKRAFLSKKS